MSISIKRHHQNPIYKDTAYFLKTSEETKGEYTRIELSVTGDGGNTPHFHKGYSERFTVLEGRLRLLAGDKYITLKEGESFLVPPLMKHCFAGEGNSTAKFIVEFRPGQPGFEKGLAIGYGLAKDGLTNKKGVPKNFTHLAVLMHLTQSYIPGIIFSFLNPVITWIAVRAIAKGEDKKLVERYCYEQKKKSFNDHPINASDSPQ
jgi:mannose-6-phosphate isomerase-like protein (cupin superfamily)